MHAIRSVAPTARLFSVARVGGRSVCLTQRLFSSSAASASPAAVPASVTVNGVSYRVPSAGRPLVAILIDGGSQEYLSAASAAGHTPFLDSLLASSGGPGNAPLGQASSSRGVHALVAGQIPTLTNPNNVAIVCGAPASVTGISGNYFLDESVEPPVEQLMNSAAFLRAETVFARLQKEAGVNVTIVRHAHTTAEGRDR